MKPEPDFDKPEPDFDIERFFRLDMLINEFVNLAKIVKSLALRFFSYLKTRAEAHPKGALGFIIFLLIFIYTDKSAQKKIEYKKSLSPNLTWRVIAVFLYLPAWLQLIGGNLFRLLLHGSGVGLGRAAAKKIYQEFGFAILLLGQIEGNFWMKLRFETIYNICLFFGLQAYMIEKWNIHKGIQKHKIFTYIKIPMFLKYHIMYVAVVESMFMTIKFTYDSILNFIVKLLTALFPSIDGFSFIISCNWCWLVFMIIIIGNGFWKATRGISFTHNGFIDDFMRIHLGAVGLDPDEQWLDYGMDDYKKKYY